MEKWREKGRGAGMGWGEVTVNSLYTSYCKLWAGGALVLQGQIVA